MFLLVVVSTIPAAVASKWSYDRRVKQWHWQEFERTRASLEAGRIFAGQSGEEYLRIANPYGESRDGELTIYYHGLPGRGYAGIVIHARRGYLVRAALWSCVGREVYFDVLSPADRDD